MTDINESYLNKLYEDLHRDQMKIMTDMKNANDLESDKQNQRLLTFLNTIMINTLRLRNLKKTIQEKINC
jgi:hypothetical protein